MTISGKVVNITLPETGQGKNGEWSKRFIVIETLDDKYPKEVAIESWNDKVELPKIGDSITAHINLDSREWQGRYFTSAKVWKIEVESNSAVEVSAPVDDETDGVLPF